MAITLSKLNQYFSDLRIYDISLHGDVCVAAIVGFGDLFMGIGVAAHWRTEDAVKSAARECLSHVQMYSPWDSGASLDEHYRRDVGALENSYSRNYFKSYDPDTLRNAYRYLEASVPSSRHDAEVPQDLGALMERIGKVISDLHIEPLIARLPTPIDLPMFKTAKILALEAYPHMNFAEFDPEEYAISYHRGDVTFPNRGIMIPFP